MDLGLFMIRRILSNRQSYAIADFSPILSQARLSIGLLAGAFFLLPSAQAASCKLPKSYYKNVSCTASSGYFLAEKDFGAPVALINSKGKKVVDLTRYQEVDANNLSGGLLPVLRNSHVGYVNMQGREVVPIMYDRLTGGQGWARPVSDGRIVVKKDGNYGVINTSNNTVVSFSSAIDDIENYRNGRAKVSKNRSTSWLDKNGNTINDNDDKKTKATPSRSRVSTATPQRKLAPTGFTTLQPHQQDGKWGFVDDNNVTMITYSFDEVRPFSERLAGIRIGKEWGFINLGGELVIPFAFADDGVRSDDNYQGKPSFVFTSGKAWVGNLKNGIKMCVDKDGESVACG